MYLNFVRRGPPLLNFAQEREDMREFFGVLHTRRVLNATVEVEKVRTCRRSGLLDGVRAKAACKQPALLRIGRLECVETCPVRSAPGAAKLAGVESVA